MAIEDYVYIPEWLEDTPLGAVYAEVWDETGSGQAAIDAVRAHEAYDTYFAGNKREDGTVRYEEAEYLSQMESYEDSLVAVGLERDFVRAYFKDDFVRLIEGNVDGTEFWMERVKPTWDRVTQASDAIRAEYAGQLGIELTDEAIFASLMNEAVQKGVLDQTIAMSEIRGAYAERFDDINALENDYFMDLYKRGDIDLGAARALYANADTMMPVLSALASRHADPDDDFDIYEFTNAQLVTDPQQVSRMRRLMAQERASFQKASAQVDYARNRVGGAAGLEER